MGCYEKMMLEIFLTGLFVEEVEEFHKVFIEDVAEGVAEVEPDDGDDKQYERGQNQTDDGESLAAVLAENAHQGEGESEDAEDEAYKGNPEQHDADDTQRETGAT